MKAENFFEGCLLKLRSLGPTDDIDIWFEIHGWRVDICIGKDGEEWGSFPVRATKKDEGEA